MATQLKSLPKRVATCIFLANKVFSVLIFALWILKIFLKLIKMSNSNQSKSQTDKTHHRTSSVHVEHLVTWLQLWPRAFKRISGFRDPESPISEQKWAITCYYMYYTYL